MKKILIIEDEKILAEMYNFKLKKEGYQVFNAIDVDTGIEIAKKEQPDLVVLDMLLPKESGINYLIKAKNIKEIIGEVVSDKTAKTRVIVVKNVKVHPIYKKRFVVKTKYYVHDEENQSKL